MSGFNNLDGLNITINPEPVDALVPDFESLNISTSDEGNPKVIEPKFCACGSSCATKKCGCRKRGELCDPAWCGCCTVNSPYCQNIDMSKKVYNTVDHFLDASTQVSSFPVSNGKRLVIASWNIQSFGHNRLIGADQLSKPFQLAIEKIATFVQHHDVDIIFIQETLDIEALHDLVKRLNQEGRNIYHSSCVGIGEGFSLTAAAKHDEKKPTEFAAVIFKESESSDWSIPNPNLELHEFHLEGLHPSITELRDRFKRQPSSIVVEFGGETFCFVTMHVASNSGPQRLRNISEIRALGPLAISLKAKNKADHVILVGDFNRSPNSVVYSHLYQSESGHVPTVITGKTNRGKEDHIYDNFFVPSIIRSERRCNAFICGEEWVKSGVKAYKPISDHVPVILELKSRDNVQVDGEVNDQTPPLSSSDS